MLDFTFWSYIAQTQILWKFAYLTSEYDIVLIYSFFSVYQSNNENLTEPPI